MTYRTINPATGGTDRTFGDISDGDLDNALEVARSCYQDDWRHRAVADCARIVKAAAAALRANAASCAQYVTAEMGKLIGTSEAEVGLSAAILDYYADRAESFLAPQELPESPGGARRQCRLRLDQRLRPARSVSLTDGLCAHDPG